MSTRLRGWCTQGTLSPGLWKSRRRFLRVGIKTLHARRVKIVSFSTDRAKLITNRKSILQHRRVYYNREIPYPAANRTLVKLTSKKVRNPSLKGMAVLSVRRKPPQAVRNC